MQGHITPLAFTQVPSEQQYNEKKQEKKVVLLFSS